MDKELKINNRLEISYKGLSYKSNIQDSEGGIVALSVPYKNNSYIVPEIGEELEVIYYDSYDKVFRFTSKVVGKKTLGIPVILIERPNNIEKLQRRDYVRISYLNDIYYSIISNNIDIEKIDEIGIANYLFKRGKLIDISGGGMRISIDEEANIGDQLFIRLQFPPKEFYIGCKVSRIEDTINKSKNLGLKFHSIKNNEREEIIKFIFKRMLVKK